MIQTSGTTGQPKVVFVPHRCIVPNILHLRSIFEVHPEDNIIQLAPLTFDPSVVEIFLALTSGASIVFVPEKIKSMPKKLSLTLKKQNITILQATPTLVSNFGIEVLKESILSESSLIRILAFGGEECPLPSSINKWKSENNSTRFFNLYGITEVSCWSTYCEILPEDLMCINKVTRLGECFVDTEVQVLNEENLEIDYGEGELYIGGARQCFINEEIQMKNLNKQMRATGDWVYKKENGDLLFIKRKDSVVKHNGKKINIALIENNIRKLTFVNCCSTFYHKEEKLLYVFIIPVDKQKDPNQIEMEIFKIFKFEQSVTIPFVVQVIYSFPQTTHGKLDYEVLINYVKCKRKRKNMEDFNVHEELLTLWKKYTGLVSINATENHQFIYDGGDSIGAVQLSKEIEWYIGNDYPLLIEKLLNCSLQDVLNYLIEFNDEGKRVLPVNENTDLRLIKRSKINNPPEEIKDFDEKNTHREYSKIHVKNEARSCFHDFSRRGIVKRCACLLCSNTLNLSNKENFSSVSLKCIWNYDLEKCIDASPLVIKDLREYTTAFIGSHSGQFVAIDIKNGKKIWEIVLNGRIESSACVSYCGNYIAVGCYDFSIYCLEKTTGKVHWKITTGAEVKCSPISDCFKNVLYCGSHDKHLYAIDINTGIIMWKQKIGNGSIFSSPVVNKEPYYVVAASLDGTISSVNPENGNILWTYNCQKPVFSSPLNLKCGLCIGSVNGDILFLNHHGKIMWTVYSESPVFSSASQISLDANTMDSKDFVVIGSDSGIVFCINSTNGVMVWTFQCNSSVYATPFVSININQTVKYLVVIASKLGTLYILDGLTGKELCKYFLGGEIFSSPVICDNYLIVGCRDNFVYCFKISFL
ncbi:beta-alanine-activating enzyme isoform X2 [Centruroides vittatus]